MSERTRRTILGVFLGGVLGVTVGAVWLFAGERRSEATALGEEIEWPSEGFGIRMPRGWGRVRVEKRSFTARFVYVKPVDKDSRRDSLTRRIQKRWIYFFSISPGATEGEAAIPVLGLAMALASNDREFHSPKKEKSQLIDAAVYERRESGYSYFYRNYDQRMLLLLYQQISVGERVFWCVMLGNTELTEADRALLEAVSSSFTLLGESG